MNHTLREGYFPSANKQDEIYYCMMIPPTVPSGVVVVNHGMKSYSGCYRAFAEFLCDNGFAVVLYDMAGHGKSVKEGGLFGSFAPADGDVVLIKDLDTLVGLVRKRYRHLPLFVYGHSLGSFVARAYIASHKEAFDGAIFSGTAERMRFSFFQKRKLKKLCAKAGRAYSKEVEDYMIGDFACQFPEEGSWLTTDPAQFAAFAEDPLCGNPMCADAYYDMFRLMEYISSDEWVEEAPKGLSMLFQAGERDPLGGQNLTDLCEALCDKGATDVSLALYKGEKHETLGSLSDEAVKRDILAFLKDKAKDVTALRMMQF